MDYLIKSIGIIIAIAGVIFVMMPSLMTKLVAWAKVGKRVYIGGVIRLVVGGLLIGASPVDTTMWIPFVLGMIMVIAGILIFVMGVEMVHRFLGWWESKSEDFQRGWAVAAAIIGVLLIYSA